VGVKKRRRLFTIFAVFYYIYNNNLRKGVVIFKYYRSFFGGLFAELICRNIPPFQLATRGANGKGEMVR
jgi:hypothetical protein